MGTMIAPALAATALPEQPTAMARLLDGLPIVCFANDWNGDPTSKHHIMRSLARHTDVLWVESSGMRMPRLTGGDLKRVWSKLRGAGGGARAAEPGVEVLSPLSLPLPGSRLAQRLNRRLYHRALAERPALTGPRPPLLWVYTPTVAPYLDGLPNSGIVYHCVDRWWEFEEYDADVMMRHHVQLCRRADVVFASSHELLLDCEPHARNAHLVRHGVEWEHFAAAALDEALPEPEELADVDGPVIGFFGLIHDWIDQELLVRVARALPHATLVLIGKTRVPVDRLARLPNVRLIGQQPYDRLPAFARRFDVALIPFVVNELTLAVNPIKLREYLSAGVPVVSTALPELRVFEEHERVAIADDGDGFVDAVTRALEHRDAPGERRTAALAMRSESWGGRCTEMVALWHEAVSAPPEPAIELHL